MEFSDKFYRSIIENMVNAFAFHEILTDECGKPLDYRYIDINSAFECLTGLKKEKVIGKTVRQILPDIEKDEVDWISIYGEVALSGKPVDIMQYVSGLERWYGIHAFSPMKRYFITIFNDVTLLKVNEAQLEQQNKELLNANRIARENERRLNKAQALANAGNWEIDLHTGNVWASEEAFRIYGLERKSPYLPLPAVQSMVQSQYRRKLDEALHDLITKRMPYNVEFAINDPSVQEKYIHSVAELETDADGKPERVLGVLQDITARVRYENILHEKNRELSALYEEVLASEEALKEQQERLQYLAYHDSLTDLPNRSLFMNRLDIAISLSERSRMHAAVVFLDIDNFKDVNDILGHSVGDKLLKAIAWRLSQRMRKYETLARLGGDEFALLAQNVKDPREAYELCQRLKNDLDKTFEFDGYNFNMSVSMGIAMYPDDGTTAEELLKNADTAMYKTKAMGKNNIQFFREEMKTDILRRLMINNCVRKALEHDGFSLHYQPLVELRTGVIRSFEALLRCNDTELGAISPKEIIPVAEDTGLIVPLGEWVLTEACRQGAEWNRTCSPELLISVNISAVQLKQSNFAEMVKHVLDETGFEPAHLELEVTESLLINSFEQTVAMLEELRGLGVRVSMDDFGTGYSSLNYLKRLPLNTLKIDQSFIRDIDTGSMEKDITGSIVSLVQKLQIEVVAEGVETESQLEYLIGCSCDNVQGYLMSKPLPPAEVPKLMEIDYFDAILRRGGYNAEGV